MHETRIQTPPEAPEIQAGQRRLELARNAFQEFYAQCFWSYRPDMEITEDKIPFIVRGLREHGGLAGYRIAAEVMPLGQFEGEVLRLLAANRNPDSYVGGATVLNQAPSSLRISRDVDVFHDTLESLAASADRDFATLRAAGYEVAEAGRRHDTFCRATVRRGHRQTKMEWVFDSAFRFFPVEPDPELGWRLNFWDAAVNKVLAFAGRPEIRDWVDVLHLHECHLHLGALAWAGTGKDPGLSPEAIIRWGGRQAVYRPEDLAALALVQPFTLSQLKEQWLEASVAALKLIAQLPLDEVGCLYLDATSKVMCPDPLSADFPKLTRHFGSVKGTWPRIVQS